MAMNFRYPNIIRLAGVNLTDESRGPLQEARDERSIEVALASGKIKKFVQQVARTWSVSWENVGMSADETIDGFGARNELRSIAEGAGAIELVIQDGRNAPETYTVYIDDYDEEIVMRQGPGQMFRYKLNLSLKERG